MAKPWEFRGRRDKARKKCVKMAVTKIHDFFKGHRSINLNRLEVKIAW